jgi:hypothetical protein
MLRRTTLFACPACTRHLLPTETSCPGCGAPIRNADGSIGRTQIALMMGLGAVFGFASAGCGSSVEGTGGAGGQGVSTGDTTTTGTTSASSSTGFSTTKATVGMTYASSTYGQGFNCDNGTPGDLDSQVCDDCFECSATIGNFCKPEYEQLVNHPDVPPFFECFDACADVTCEQACVDMFPRIAQLYFSFVNCTVCKECYTNCDGSTNCQ